MKKSTMLLAALTALTVVTAAGVARAADLTPAFGFVAPGWTPVQSQDLSAFWAQAGFQETGVTNYSVGGPTAASPYWERFDPLGATYEAFFGTYVIEHFKYASDWVNPDGTPRAMTVDGVRRSAQELLALSNVDQEAWLAAFSAPFGGPDGSVDVPGSLTILPAPGGFFLLTFLVDTTSDLGAPVQPEPIVPPYATYASDVAPFEPVVVEATVLVKYDVPSGDFLAVYGSGANYQVDGRDRNTPLSTLVQIGQMMTSTTFH